MVMPKGTFKDKVFAAGATKRCFNTWRGMNDRCMYKSHANYRHYGGRGIKVCKRWKRENADANKFMNFYKDLGNPPKNHSLDRINVDGDYKPSNCQWMSHSYQVSNQRKKGAITSFTPEELAAHVKTLSEDDFLLFFRIITSGKTPK